MRPPILCEVAMKGTKHIRISNRHVQFDFTLQRNITLVRGDSGSGKSTLFALISDYMREGEQSGVNLSSPCPCIALSDAFWEEQLQRTSRSIVFADEGARFLQSHAFAEAVKSSDNYYVLITREDLHELPYSVEEIYEIKTSGKRYHSFQKLYTLQNGLCRKAENADMILTEDSKSGFQFFSALAEEKAIKCLSSEGNSNFYKFLQQHPQTAFFIVADGAAFGAEIDRVLKAIGTRKNVTLFLPESFEWLILRSGLVRDCEAVLESPDEHIESGRYFSWEQFFTAYLTEKTAGTYLAYRKDTLNPAYLQEQEKEAITAQIPEIG